MPIFATVHPTNKYDLKFNTDFLIRESDIKTKCSKTTILKCNAGNRCKILVFLPTCTRMATINTFYTQKHAQLRIYILKYLLAMALRCLAFHFHFNIHFDAIFFAFIK